MIDEIEQKLGYVFGNQALLVAAFTHKSYLNEQNNCSMTHNERLEFLGDAVLNLIISDFLYRTYPDKDEGVLSDWRSRLVETSALQRYVEKLGVAPFVILGKGEKKSVRKESIHADLFEAILGAIYLDRGLEAAHAFLFNHFTDDFTATLLSPSQNWKALLQDYAQKTFRTKPEYCITKEEGPDHHKTFYVKVLIEGQIAGEGVGHSKKEAEASAAEAAMKGMNEN